MTKIESLTSLTLCLFASGALAAQAPVPIELQPRSNYGAKLEIPGKVLHGAGQDDQGFAGYWTALEANKKPAMIMAYTQLRGNLKSDFAALRRTLNDYESKNDVYLLAQIGLAMTNDGSPESCYDEAVAAGTYDQAIETLCQCIAELGHPVLLRIGYEFNGTSWNGYHPEAYKKAFAKISKALRDHRLEAAAVWNAAGEIDYLQSLDRYYPGDEWVDWWAINLFSGPERSNESIFRHPSIEAFMREAHNHRKPVLVGESTPRYTGAQQGEPSWKAWYRDYFQFIASWPGVKAFSYINWDWSPYPQWKNWGDARIEKNAYVRERYNAALHSSAFFHGVSEKRYRSSLGWTRTELPPPPNFKAIWSAENSAAQLKWDSAGKNVLRYEILIGGVKAASTTALTYADTENVVSGRTLAYSVRAVNAIGEPGPPSLAASVKFPSSLVKVRGFFGRGLGDWNLRLFNGATGTLNLEPGVREDQASARVEIKDGKGSNWFAQFVHPLKVVAGKTYTLKFSCRADQDGLPIEAWIQQNHAPYAGIVSHWSFSPSQKPQSFQLQVQAPNDDTMNLSFMLGKMTHPAVVWFEGITVVEE